MNLPDSPAVLAGMVMRKDEQIRELVAALREARSLLPTSVITGTCGDGMEQDAEICDLCGMHGEHDYDCPTNAIDQLLAKHEAAHG